MEAVDAIWGAIILAFLSFEVWTIRNKEPGDTFSERTRHYFRVESRAGTWVFLAILGAAAAWFSAHIVQIAI